MPPVTASPSCLVDGDRLAGHHRFVDGAAPFDDDAVDRHLLAGPYAADDRRPARRSAASRSVAVAQRRARSSAPGRAAGGSPCPSGCARAARAPVPSRHERRDDDGGVEVGLDRRRASGNRRETRPARMRADARCSYAAPTPSAMSVNMFGLRLTIDAHAARKTASPPRTRLASRQRPGPFQLIGGPRVIEIRNLRPAMSSHRHRRTTGKPRADRHPEAGGSCPASSGSGASVSDERARFPAPCRRSGTTPGAGSHDLRDASGT